jgi:hypothetical protein
LEDSGYAVAYPCLNTVAYLQLASATVNEAAYHLVQKFEMDKDGHTAWKNMCKWYDGETVKSEMAVSIRSKIEGLQLTTSISRSDYVNKFLAWHCDLERIKGEGMSTSQPVSVLNAHKCLVSSNCHANVAGYMGISFTHQVLPQHQLFIGGFHMFQDTMC